MPGVVGRAQSPEHVEKRASAMRGQKRDGSNMKWTPERRAVYAAAAAAKKAEPDVECPNCGRFMKSMGITAHAKKCLVFKCEFPDCDSKLRCTRRFCVDHYALAKLVRKYGITIDQYIQMYRDQDGRCAICDVEMIWRMTAGADRSRVTCIDHDAVTSVVRALLCFSCNVALGHMHDDPERLRAAAGYIEHHRAG